MPSVPPRRRSPTSHLAGAKLVSATQRYGWEAALTGPIRRLLAARQARVLAAVAQAMSAQTAAMGPVDPFGADTWQQDVESEVMEPAAGVFNDVAESGLRHFVRVPGAGQLWQLDMTDNLARFGGRLVGIGTETGAGIGRALSVGFANGESVPELAARVRDVFDASNYRSTMIARTEVAYAVEGSALQYAQAIHDSGIAMEKRWLDADGACDDCVDIAAEDPVPVDEAFASGDDAPPAHPNCRCTVTYTPAPPPDDQGAGDTGNPGDTGNAGDGA